MSVCSYQTAIISALPTSWLPRGIGQASAGVEVLLDEVEAPDTRGLLQADRDSPSRQVLAGFRAAVHETGVNTSWIDAGAALEQQVGEIAFCTPARRGCALVIVSPNVVAPPPYMSASASTSAPASSSSRAISTIFDGVS